MKLMSMTDFVLEQKERIPIDITFIEYSEIIINYANFLKHPLEIWMFLPCELVDGIWLVLEDPKCTYIIENCTNSKCLKYQKAKEKCFFKLITKYNIRTILQINENIEEIIELGLELTRTAIKQINI